MSTGVRMESVEVLFGYHQHSLKSPNFRSFSGSSLAHNIIKNFENWGRGTLTKFLNTNQKSKSKSVRLLKSLDKGIVVQKSES